MYLIQYFEIAPFNDFTRTTDGAKRWTEGTINAILEYILVSIALVALIQMLQQIAFLNIMDQHLVIPVKIILT